jgi:hypothetical protein
VLHCIYKLLRGVMRTCGVGVMGKSSSLLGGFYGSLSYVLIFLLKNVTILGDFLLQNRHIPQRIKRGHV